MRPHIPATDRIGNRQIDRTNQILTVIGIVCFFQSRVVVTQIFHPSPAIVVERTAQIVFLFFPPDFILIIVRRTARTDTTSIFRIIINFCIFISFIWCNSCTRLSVRCLNRSPLRPIWQCITHCIDTVILIQRCCCRMSDHIHDTLGVTHINFCLHTVQVMH